MSVVPEYRIPYGDGELIVTPEHITSPICSIAIEPYEAVVLHHLYAAAKQVVAHTVIRDIINGIRNERSPVQHASKFVRKLKNKLDSATGHKVWISNVHGKGYRLLY